MPTPKPKRRKAVRPLRAWAWFDDSENLIFETISQTKEEAMGDGLYHKEDGDYLSMISITELA